MRGLGLCAVGLLLAGLTGCPNQPKEVFAYRLPDAPLRRAVDPPQTAGATPPARNSTRRLGRVAALDLNRAPLAALAAVPGLNRELAQRILAQRPLHAKRDLLRLRLLTPAQYATAKPYLVVHRAAPRR